jgi:hypothetical protein
MNCVCGVELIWGGDHSDEDDQDYAMESNYHCPDCQRMVMVYLPHPEEAAES